MNKLTITVLTLMLAVSSFAAAETLQLEGSTTVGPIGDAFAEAFMDAYPEVKITVKKTGSGDGAAALVDSRCDIAMMSRFMKGKEFKKASHYDVFPVAHAIAMDGVCVVVHPSNPINKLTSQQIRDIYTGKITNWKELGGADLKIVPLTRDTSSGTFETFHKLLMKKEKMAPVVETVNSNPQAHARVKSTKGAIGYVGIAFLDAKVSALKVDEISPSRETIASGEYPIARPLFLFTNGYPKLGSNVFKFCTFHLSEKGQEIIESKGFIPVTSY